MSSSFKNTLQNYLFFKSKLDFVETFISVSFLHSLEQKQFFLKKMIFNIAEYEHFEIFVLFFCLFDLTEIQRISISLSFCILSNMSNF